MTRDRWAGALSIGLAIAALAEATTFHVRFLTDPVGPRGFPLLAGALLLAAGVSLAAGRHGEGGGTGGDTGDRVLRWRSFPRSLLLAATLLVYAFLIPWLGFLLSTVLALWATALLFEGRPVRGMVAALVVSVGLWLLFERALGIYLPVGMLWGLGR